MEATTYATGSWHVAVATKTLLAAAALRGALGLFKKLFKKARTLEAEAEAAAWVVCSVLAALLLAAVAFVSLVLTAHGLGLRPIRGPFPPSGEEMACAYCGLLFVVLPLCAFAASRLASCWCA